MARDNIDPHMSDTHLEVGLFNFQIQLLTNPTQPSMAPSMMELVLVELSEADMCII